MQFFYRAILVEVGFQAGQHELLAEYLSTEGFEEIQAQWKDFHNQIKDGSKLAKRERAKLKSGYLDLEKAKLKHEKSYHDWKEAERIHRLADHEGVIARNEIMKMKLYADA